MEAVVIGLVVTAVVVALLTVAYWWRTQQPTPTPTPSTHLRIATDQDPDDEVTIVAMRPILAAAGIEGPASEPSLDAALGSVVIIKHDAVPTTSPKPMLLYCAVGQTHPGMRRSRNEDAFLVLKQHNVFVVADGMGGYAGGDVASQLTCETIRDAYEKDCFEVAGADGLTIEGAQLAGAVQMANRSVWEQAQGDAQLSQMGTTVVAARFSPSEQRLYLAHVGDSRCYRLRHQRLERLTADHTMRELAGVVNGPHAEMLVRAVGRDSTICVDIVHASPVLGDLYLLCTDGLNKMIGDEKIAEVLKSGKASEAIVEELIEHANAAGGRDNVTAVVIRVGKPEQFAA